MVILKYVVSSPRSPGVGVISDWPISGLLIAHLQGPLGTVEAKWCQSILYMTSDVYGYCVIDYRLPS